MFLLTIILPPITSKLPAPRDLNRKTETII
jgi:hypothetical protein